MNSNERHGARQHCRVLLLESFYGGSHRDVADNLAAHSSHEIHLLTLPDRFWKWRMRAASLWFANQIEQNNKLGKIDLVLCTTLMDLSALKAILGKTCPPLLLYCHETQLAYPRPGRSDSATESTGPGLQADLHFAFTDMVNMIVADRVLFNSQSHRGRFLKALPGFLRKFPEYRPMWAVDLIRGKSDVCYPGIEFEGETEEARSTTPLIIWNHRWEFDKAPGAFFAALTTLADEGVRFDVALLGENYQTSPPEFPDAREALGSRIVQYGYVPDRSRYRRWLSQGHIVVSTAIQENFGISILEAIAHGCHPVLPRRLSYPELIPPEFHRSVFYEGPDELVDKLRERILAIHAHDIVDSRETLRADPALLLHARSFSWSERIHEFDRQIAMTVDPGE